jgi:DNA-binding transcriptional LysR family regulator
VGAISQQLKQLETLLGVEITRKEGRNVRLTDVGQLLAQRTRDPFDSIEQAVEDAIARGRGTQKLRLKVMPTFAIRWLIPRLASLYAMSPNIDLEITTGASATVDTELGSMDFVLRHGKGTWDGVASHRIFEDAYVPVCAPRVAAALRKPEDLLRLQLLHSLMIPSAWDAWFESAGVSGTPAQPGLTLANAALCYQAAIDGLGAAIAQLAYVQDDLSLGRLVRPFEHVAHTGLAYYMVCGECEIDRGPISQFRRWLEAQSSPPSQKAAPCSSIS